MVRFKNRYLLFHVHWITPPSPATKDNTNAALAKLSGGQPKKTPVAKHDSTIEKIHIYPDVTTLEKAGVSALHGGNLVKYIRDAIQLNVGDYGAGSTSTISGTLFLILLISRINGELVKYYNAETCVGILRVPFSQHASVWAVLSTISEMKNVKCSIRVVHSSGTIQRCQKKALEDDQKRLRYLKYAQELQKEER